jgi:hypothetical protein
MVHKIIANLSAKQAIEILAWAEEKIKGSINPSGILLNSFVVEEGRGDFARFLLHIIVEKDTNDELGLIQELEDNADWLDRERYDEQETKGDVIDLIALFVSTIALLYQFKTSKPKETIIVNVNIYLQTKEGLQLITVISDELKETLRNIGLFNTNNIIVQGNNNIIICDGSNNTVSSPPQ